MLTKLVCIYIVDKFHKLTFYPGIIVLSFLFVQVNYRTTDALSPVISALVWYSGNDCVLGLF